MTDLIDHFQNLRDRLDELMSEERVRAGKLQKEMAEMEMRILMANALSALERAVPYVRHEGPRSQITGARDQLRKALAG